MADNPSTPPDTPQAADQSAIAEEADTPKSSVKDKAGQPTISVKVYAPFHVYYEGEAHSLSAVNDVGPFDVLPGHHNFLCMLVPSDVELVLPDKRIKKVKINRALMHVHSNHVTVFIDV